MELEISESVLDTDEYIKLRKLAGLSAKSKEAALIALPNSLYSIQFRKEGNLIAMGRVIGDGACFFQIVDIAVDPKFQNMGLGKRVMQYIEKYINQVALVGSYVSLIADEPEFYKKLGYKFTAPISYGMYKKF